MTLEPFTPGQFILLILAIPTIVLAFPRANILALVGVWVWAVYEHGPTLSLSILAVAFVSVLVFALKHAGTSS